MAGQKIAIYLQNMMGDLKFIIVYPRFWYKQTYEPFCIYNENK